LKNGFNWSFCDSKSGFLFGAAEPFSRFAPKTLGKNYILSIYFLFRARFSFFKRKRCGATLFKKALTEKFRAFVIAKAGFSFVQVSFYIKRKVRGKGFEPSHPLRNKALNLAPLTKLGHPRIGIEVSQCSKIKK
jgi:hypothetical protein